MKRFVFLNQKSSAFANDWLHSMLQMTVPDGSPMFKVPEHSSLVSAAWYGQALSHAHWPHTVPVSVQGLQSLSTSLVPQDQLSIEETHQYSALVNGHAGHRTVTQQAEVFNHRLLHQLQTLKEGFKNELLMEFSIRGWVKLKWKFSINFVFDWNINF